MKTVPFTKMHGLGNDFVIINVHQLAVSPRELPIAAMANRHLGIGFDQLLVITPKQKIEEFFCQIYNADGSEAEQCGNGLRCAARYIQEEGLYTQPDMEISTIAGAYPVKIHNFDRITVDMGHPQIREKSFVINNSALKEPLKVHMLDLGNPHAIVNIGHEVPAELARQIANEISASSHFPTGVNVGFIEVVDKNHIRLRTIERGAGETCACGSNACAAAITGISNGWLNSPVKIEFRYGSLEVSFQGGNHRIEMTGPAARVFKGEYSL